DKLVYSYDHDQDNVNDRWVRDLDDLQAPAVRVTTQLAGAQTIRTRWSDDYSQLLYWTGPGVFGELYMVEFDGATPSAPILLNPPEQPVLVNSFQFEQLGRVLFRSGSGNDVVGIGRVEVAGGLAGSVEVVSESLPPGAEIDSFIRRSDRLVYQVSDPGTQ